MDFGSKYIFCYSDSEEEAIDEDAYDAGLEAHLCKEQPRSNKTGSLSKKLNPLAKRSYAKIRKNILLVPPSLGDYPDELLKETKKKIRKTRRADTNIISVKCGHLTVPCDMHAGDPVYCSGCGAVLSHISSITVQGDEKHWKCEFCYADNTVDVEEDEKPQADDVTFMLKPAAAKSAGGESDVDRSLVVFCIDISGSMCVTSEIPGRISMKGSHVDRLQHLNLDHENQFFPHQSRNVTFVSRLQAVQAAVESQLESMAKEHPDWHIAVVTFNNEVTIMGIGDNSDIHFSGDKLQNKDEMIAAGQQVSMPQALKMTYKKLSDKLYDLEEGGQTALGPALLLSVAMASQMKGSKVIICTDGKANVGLGNLDVTSEEQFCAASEFYEALSQLASANSVSVSVITLKDTDCKLVELGKISVNTGGQVNIVDPMDLKDEFSNIFAEATIATNVTATVILHDGLYFRNTDNQCSKVVQQIGNVTENKEITFEYGVKKSYRRKKSTKNVTDSAIKNEEQPADVGACGGVKQFHSLDELEQLPFQLQLVYTDMDGNQAMRLLTQRMHITKDRNLAETEMNPLLVGVHGARQTGQLASKGCYTRSRLKAQTYHNILSKNVHSKESEEALDCYLLATAPVESTLSQLEEEEDCTSSDDDFERYHNKVLFRRRMAIPDRSANLFHKAGMASFSRSQLQKPRK